MENLRGINIHARTQKIQNLSNKDIDMYINQRNIMLITKSENSIKMLNFFSYLTYIVEQCKRFYVFLTENFVDAKNKSII